MGIKTVAVVGAGTMGSSIVVALIGSGYRVILKDVSVELLESGTNRIHKFLSSMVKKGLSETDAAARRSLVTTALDYTAFFEADVVIEAVLENIDIKRSVFADLEKNCRAEAILATNTSSLSISRIAAGTDSPQRVIGLHFFNPAHLMKLVEVIPGLKTAADTVSTSMTFVATLGKMAVRVEECPSFLVNRLLGRYMNEALWCLQEGAGIENIDKAACDYVMPIGPLALRDMNGADVGLSVGKFNFSEYGERFLPPPILQAMVDKNWLGQKTGRGFYSYDPETKKRTQPNPQVCELVAQYAAVGDSTGVDGERLLLPMINEAYLALQEKICACEDLDPAMMAGLGMRKGPLELAREIGLGHCLQKMEAMFAKYGERFRPAPLLKRHVWAEKPQ